MKLVVDGTEVQAQIEKDWSEVGTVGYSVNYSETAFTKLEIEGE